MNANTTARTERIENTVRALRRLGYRASGRHDAVRVRFDDDEPSCGGRLIDEMDARGFHVSGVYFDPHRRMTFALDDEGER